MLMFSFLHGSKTLVRFCKKFEEGGKDTVERGGALILYVKPISINHTQESSKRIYSIDMVGLGTIASSV
jgi:hypothetical protein